MKQYVEIDSCDVLGTSIDRVILRLIEKSVQTGELYSVCFNGAMLYSDTVSLDSAYTEVCGCTFSVFRERREQERKDYEARKAAHKNAIPALVEKYKAEGREVLDEKYIQKWDDCLIPRLTDLYEGMELGCTLKLIRLLKAGDFEGARQEFGDQGHSGMSAGLVKHMLRAFSDQGEEFCRTI